MKLTTIRIFAATVMLALTTFGAQALEIGQKAPEFEAQSTHGTVRLADYLGRKPVVLSFYFADFTST